MELLKRIGTWVLSHKAEIGTFLFAGSIAVAPEDWRPTLIALATAFGSTATAKIAAKNTAKSTVVQHLKQKGLH